MSVFGAAEPKTVETVLARVNELDAGQLRDLCQTEAGCGVDDADVIPYEEALVGAGHVSTPTSRRLERETAECHALLTS